MAIARDLQLNRKNLNADDNKALSCIERIAILLLLLSGYLQEEYIAILQVVLLCIFSVRIYIHKRFLWVFLILILHGAINIFLGNVSINQFAGQIMGIGINIIFFFSVLRNAHLISLIKFYVRVTLYLSLIVFVQQLGSLLNIELIYDARNYVLLTTGTEHLGPFIRARALFGEPSAYAIAICPAMYLALDCILNRNKEILTQCSAIIILAAYILTFSSIGYIGILICCILIIIDSKNPVKKMLILLVSIFVAVYAYFNISELRMRIDDTILAFFENDFYKTNLSSSTLTINAKIAWRSFLSSWGFGSGLGSYRNIYQKYVYQVVDVNRIQLLLNQYDANSLALRTLAELGWGGILAIAIFLFKFHVKQEKGLHRVVSNSLFVMFLLRILRQGHYFYNSLFMFVFIYINLKDESNKT